MPRRRLDDIKAEAARALGVRALKRRVYDPLNPPDIHVWREVLRRIPDWDIPLYHANAIEAASTQLVEMGRKPAATEEDRLIGVRAASARDAIRDARIKQLASEDISVKIVRMVARKCGW
jgi:hypothetical protein